MKNIENDCFECGKIIDKDGEFCSLYCQQVYTERELNYPVEKYLNKQNNNK